MEVVVPVGGWAVCGGGVKVGVLRSHHFFLVLFGGSSNHADRFGKCGLEDWAGH
jgi:hypothetical protein